MSVSNPFAVQKTESTAIEKSTSSREIEEVRAAMIMARQFPRDEKAAMDRILNACTRPSLAESAIYSYAKGGAAVEGPSIRLAEAVAQSWGNIQFGIRELDQRSGESTVEAYAWDVETNTRESKVFHVRHWRHTRQGGYKIEDPREVYEMVANQGARRLRACILGVIPGDVIDTAVHQCSVTMAANESIDPSKVKTMVEAFAAFGVTKEQVEKRIQRRIDAITPQLMASLRKVYTSLKEGMSAPSDWFEVAATNAAPQKTELRDKVKAKAAVNVATLLKSPDHAIAEYCAAHGIAWPDVDSEWREKITADPAAFDRAVSMYIDQQATNAPE